MQDRLTRGDAYKVFEKHFNSIQQQDIQDILDSVAQDMDVLFNSSLKEKSTEGAILAAEKAPAICNKWGSKVWYYANYFKISLMLKSITIKFDKNF